MKKIFALVACLSLVASLAVGGSIAYLQSTDSAVNVMTLGNVEIEQHEQERGENEVLQAFSQGKPAYPAVGPIAWRDSGIVINNAEYKVFTDDLKNVVDKIVTVENTGKSDAFVRTIIALEAPDYDAKNLIHVNINTEGLTWTEWAAADIDGAQYVYSVFTYDEALAPKEISAPSLLQVFLDSATTNEDVAAYGDTWDILVLSQAVQAQGFENAASALDTAFEEATKENVEEWMSTVKKENVTHLVSSYQEMVEAFSKGGTVVLMDDIAVEGTIRVGTGTNVNLDMNGKTLTEKDGSIADPLFRLMDNSSLVVDGNGTIDYQDNYSANFFLLDEGSSAGKITIESGSFLKNYDTTFNYSIFAPIFVGNKNLNVTINGGYFDGGIYKEGECFESIRRNALNLTTGQTFLVYGGTFVGQNPAWGDEGRAEYCPYCENPTKTQGFFLVGQAEKNHPTELPDGYTITETTHEDGRPIFTVEYNK